jgi:hypothetical protein
VNSTSGISGLTGGNCTQEEAEQYRAHEAALRAIGWVAWSDEPRGPDQESWPRPYDTVVANLEATFRAFARVFTSAGSRLTDDELHQFEDALAELGSTVNALRM